jgi:hypothetical protein
MLHSKGVTKQMAENGGLETDFDENANSFWSCICPLASDELLEWLDQQAAEQGEEWH